MREKILECFHQIHSRNNRLNALISQSDSKALLDQLGKQNGKLAGIPIAIKDNFATADLQTTCGSKILSNYNSPIESTVVRKLKEAGGLIIGKSNMDEFGMGSFNANSFYGPTLNPIDLTRVCGGSSGGSAAAVAAGFCEAAIGSDTGGSVRLPASYCGVYGFKPSYGSISRYGLIPYANSLDTVGILSKNIDTVCRIYDVLKGKDELDPTSVDLNDHLGERKIRIGVPMEYHVEGISDAVKRVWSETLEKLERNGAEIVPVSLPSTQLALSAYYIIAPAEAYSNLAKYDGIKYGFKEPGTSYKDSLIKTRTAGFGNEVKKRIMIGAYVLKSMEKSRFYVAAQKVRRQVQEDLDKVFRVVNPLTGAKFENSPGVDFLVTPSALDVAPSFEMTKSPNYNSYVNDVFTVPVSLAGLPAISVNAGDENGLPIGMQIIGQYGSDHSVLEFAKTMSQ
ncbi:Trimeric GatFAB AmidoTransferase(AdT) complex subunit [Boothiomyces sp. JEL0866]|nr:Trimeric GatFAB AmidoTransferase(AdT) complex subunit [Boothiomyces sp. JEL0866]